jgi:hypothetical protein
VSDIFTLNMDKKALLRRKRRLERQRDAELRAYRAKWRSRINSVDRLLRAVTTADEVGRQTKPGQATRLAALATALEGKANGDRKEGVMALVRHTLQHNRGFFTARTLVEFINQTQPCCVTERDIRLPLRRLRKLGAIRVVERGTGRKPQIYLNL